MQDQLEIEQKKTKEDQGGSTGLKSGGSCDFRQESIPSLSTKIFLPHPRDMKNLLRLHASGTPGHVYSCGPWETPETEGMIREWVCFCVAG